VFVRFARYSAPLQDNFKHDARGALKLARRVAGNSSLQPRSSSSTLRRTMFETIVTRIEAVEQKLKHLRRFL